MHSAMFQCKKWKLYICNWLQGNISLCYNKIEMYYLKVRYYQIIKNVIMVLFQIIFLLFLQYSEISIKFAHKCWICGGNDWETVQNMMKASNVIRLMLSSAFLYCLLPCFLHQDHLGVCFSNFSLYHLR